MDCSLPGSSVRGILQAAILKWVAMPPSGDLTDPEIKPASLESPELAGGFFTTKNFPGGAEVKTSACSVGDLGSIPGLGRSPGGGNGNPLQYSCLENPLDRGAWQAAIHGVTKS